MEPDEARVAGAGCHCEDYDRDCCFVCGVGRAGAGLGWAVGGVHGGEAGCAGTAADGIGEYERAAQACD